MTHSFDKCFPLLSLYENHEAVRMELRRWGRCGALFIFAVCELFRLLMY